MDGTTNHRKQSVHGERGLQVLASLVGIGLVVILLYALQAADPKQTLSIIGVSAVIAGASLVLGALLGFLFGIPRMLRQSAAPKPAATGNNSIPLTVTKTNVAADDDGVMQYLPNTNLEEISDWLTKILVGVGLTQISTVSGRLQAFAEYAAAGLGGFPSSDVFAIGLLIYNLVCGFLIGYLWTRLYLAGAFREADELSALKNIVNALVDQQELDAHALGLVERQLAGEKSEVSPSELNEAIAKASESVKTQIFYRVDLARPDKDNTASARAARVHTIPILNALVESDPSNRWDESRVLLAIALVEQDTPDWARAKGLLDRAIEIRDKRLKQGSNANRWYEYYRAICNMALDPNLANGQVADDKLRQLILTDLNAASKWRGMEDAQKVEVAKKNSVVTTWLNLNKITLPTVSGA